jgi:hypothetical protein
MSNEWNLTAAFLLTAAIAVAIPVYGLREQDLRQDRSEELNARALSRGAELYVKDLAPQYGDYGEGGPAGPLRGTEKLSSRAEVRKFVAANADSLTGAQKEDLSYFLLNWSSAELARVAGVLPQVTVEAWGPRIAPSDLRLEEGQKTRLRLVNFGSAPHSLRVDGVQVKTGDGSDVSGFRLDAEPGQEATLVITPQEAGTFQVVCESTEHGLATPGGTLNVVPAEVRR